MAGLRSAVWLPDEQLLLAADGTEELLVIAAEDSGAFVPVDTNIPH